MDNRGSGFARAETDENKYIKTTFTKVGYIWSKLKNGEFNEYIDCSDFTFATTNNTKHYVMSCNF